MIHMETSGIREAAKASDDLGRTLATTIWKMTANDIQTESNRVLGLTTEYFDHSVKIKERKEVRNYGMVYELTVMDDVWNMLDLGTPPHTIHAVNSPVLAFNVGGTAKTQPGTLTTRPGTPGSGLTIFRAWVEHPGFPPRLWTNLMQILVAEHGNEQFDHWLRKFIGEIWSSSARAFVGKRRSGRGVGPGRIRMR